MGRVIGNVGQDGHQRRARGNALQRGLKRPVVVRDQRNHHVRAGFGPVPGQYLYLRTMQEANHGVHERNQLRGTHGPAAAQHDVVDVLKRDAGGFADDVDGIEQILNRDHVDVPGALLAFDHLGQRLRRGAVAAAGIDIDELDGAPHRLPPGARRGADRAVRMSCIEFPCYLEYHADNSRTLQFQETSVSTPSGCCGLAGARQTTKNDGLSHPLAGETWPTSNSTTSGVPALDTAGANACATVARNREKCGTGGRLARRELFIARLSA